MPEGHTVRLQIEKETEREKERKRERVRKNGPGTLPLLGSKGGFFKVLQVYFLLANLKHKNRN